MKDNVNSILKIFSNNDEIQPINISGNVLTQKIEKNHYVNPILTKTLSIVVLIIFILSVLGILITNILKKDRIQSLPREKLEYKQYEMKHNRTYKLNIKYYKDYLPKNKKGKRINDIKKLFDTKYLYINNEKIEFDYIYIIRQKDFQNKEQRNATFENSDINFFILDTKNNQISYVQNFYELCTDKKIKKQKSSKSYPNPLISLIIIIYNRKQNLLRTIKSIQNQSLKNLEIIIVDDKDINIVQDYKVVINNDPRIRVFIQKKSYSIWRKRIDGFLYSKGRYILHLDAGLILSDDLVLEDIYNISQKYDLDTVRFSFSDTLDDKQFKKYKIISGMNIYPILLTKILYGRPGYNIKDYGFGNIWNRLVRADIISKGLDLVDSTILNFRKNLWDGWWWNDLIDRVSFSNVVVNRLGLIYLHKKKIETKPSIRNNKEKDKTIREFIAFLYFDLILLKDNDNKKSIIDNLKKLNEKNNTYDNIHIRLDYLKNKSPIFLKLIKKLLLDPNIMNDDKIYIIKLSKQIKYMIKSRRK